MDRKNNEYVGKKLHEVKKLYKNVRVLGAGPVSMAGTCDYRLDRLNVLLWKKELSSSRLRLPLNRLVSRPLPKLTEAWMREL